MTRRYIEEPLVDLDQPEPQPAGPRPLTPRYIDVDPEKPADRPRIPDAARGLPAYQFSLGTPTKWGPVVPVSDDNWAFPAPLPPRPALDIDRMAAQIGMDPTRFGDLLRNVIDAFGPAFAKLGQAMQDATRHLRDLGLALDEPPDDVRARALWLRQHRNTGPSRDLVHQHRPRTHGAATQQSTTPRRRPHVGRPAPGTARAVHTRR